MAITVPSNDKINYAKYQEYVAAVANVAATSSTPHKTSAQDRLVAVSGELIISLMASSKVSPQAIIAACTYGT